MTYNGLTFMSDKTGLGGNVLEGDPFCYAPSVWDYTIKRFGIKSVLDLGSGAGHAAEWFFRHGCKVLAVDGLIENCNKALYPTLNLDLTKSSVVCNVDLVHCQELVEHVEEKFLENVLQSLTCGKYILMTNALPGQGGFHHVNEQPSEYWINHLFRYNCHLLEEDSNRIKKLAMQDSARYFSRTGLIFVNKNYK